MHVNTHTHTFRYFTGNWLGTQSEKWKRCCSEYCMIFWRMVQAPVPEKTAFTYGFGSHLSLRRTAKISHIRSRTHTQEKPITFRSCPSPVCPLCCSSTLLLMIFLILKKETKVRCCTLISSLWTSSGCGCYCPPLCPLKLAHTHTRANAESLTRTYYYCLGQTCWPRRQLLWMGLTESGADPLSKAWENP